MTFFVRRFLGWPARSPALLGSIGLPGLMALLGSIGLPGLMALAGLLAGCASPSTEYVGSATCGSCHSEAYAAWKTSDHMRAMQLPTSETVAGDFNDVPFDHFGDQYLFTKRDSAYVVVYNGDSLDVAYTFGYSPLQQYLLPTHGGRLQALTVAWDETGKKWYSLYPDEATPEGDALNWKSAHLNWNYMCADCHSTGLKRGYDLASDTYETSWDELTVGCEACHGPGKAHVSWAESPKGEDPFLIAIKDKVEPGIGRPNTAALEVEINMCAQCHSRRVGLTAAHDPKASYLDQYAPSLIEDSLYFGDGQIREEVYVYTSFLQSKMAQKGVTCSDCHNVHSGELKRPGNALCTGCHESAQYDTAVHTGHLPQTEAAACVSCHMPARTYMGVDPRRDHRFAVPDPILSKDIKSPNVCASCHPGKTAAWAAAEIALVRSNNPKAKPYRVNTVARAAQALKAQAVDAVAQVQLALSDSTAAHISKGSLLARLGGSSDPEAVRLVMLGLQSSAPAEVVGSLRALRAWAGMLPGPDLSPLFGNPVRWVRTEAVATALAFGTTNWTLSGPAGALKEYVASQKAVGERPEAHLNLGRMNESLRQFDLADSAFKDAVRIDSTAAEYWLEMALFRGRAAQTLRDTDLVAFAKWRQKAEESFAKAAFLPSPLRSDVLYLFGLFLAEDPVRLPDAAAVLKESVRLDPSHARKAYNAGLAFQQMKAMDSAEALLEKAVELGLDEAQDALVILYMQNGRWGEAKALNAQLMKAFPDRNDLKERSDYIASQL